jgi:hypothetical protein
MKTATAQDLPARLEAIRRRLERWRQIRTGRSRIPAGLWASAVKAAGRYGLNPTARALGLDYKSLQRHVAVAAGRSDGQIGNARPGRETPTTFVELASPVGCGSLAECVLELENAGGAKMRIHLKGVPITDLAALSRSLWGSQA